MSLVEYIIIFALAITFSSILNKLLPAIPIFMIQILMGILLGLTHFGRSISFEPEIFLVMIIAPLLFREGERANIASILKNSKLILFLAFGGVLLTLFGVGLVLSLLLPNLPLAECFAFGAALGPTDAVAVGALAKRLKLPQHVLHILEGEGLLNDASGVTAFQFALAALITGTFSLWQASASLILSTIGGVLIGIFLSWIKNWIIALIEKVSAQDVIVYLLIELLLPFAAYLIAETFHVSGIIAAVATGVLQASSFRKISLFDAELSTITTSTWNTISFTLNALVFLFLGIELSLVFSPVWNSHLYSNLHLIVIVVTIAALLFLIRFLFIGGYYLFRDKKALQTQLNEILLLTFGGVKGTVSLATIFILPLTINGLDFPQRSLLLTITACVILVTLLVGMAVLPFLSEGEAEEPVDRNAVLILEDVITVLKQDIAAKKLTGRERLAVEGVISNYHNRIQTAFTESLSPSEHQEMQEIQALILTIERDGLDELFSKHQISPRTYQFYSRFIQQFESSITRQILSLLGFWLIVGKRLLRIVLHPKMFWERLRQKQTILDAQDVTEVYNLFERNTKNVLLSLENLRDVYDDTLVDFFLEQRKLLVQKIKQRNFIDSILIQDDALFVKELIRGYYLERKTIDEYEVAEQITNFSANEYRHHVNMLESFAMSRLSETPSLQFVLRKKRRSQSK